METLSLYSDETREGGSFTITTTILGTQRVCRQYENEIGLIIADNQRRGSLQAGILHGSTLTAENWRRESPGYVSALKILFSTMQSGGLKTSIFIESNQRYAANSKYLEDTLKKHIQDRNDPFGKLFQHVPLADLSAIYKSAEKIYVYLRNRKHYGNGDETFRYYPDSSGNILAFRDRSCWIDQGGLGLVRTPFFETIKIVTNVLAVALAKTGWQKLDNQRLLEFSPMDDRDSYLIQTADIVSHFLWHLIRYLSGNKTRISCLKAMALLGFDSFRSNRRQIQREFTYRNKKLVCTNPDLEVSFSIGAQ